MSSLQCSRTKPGMVVYTCNPWEALEIQREGLELTVMAFWPVSLYATGKFKASKRFCLKKERWTVLRNGTSSFSTHAHTSTLTLMGTPLHTHIPHVHIHSPLYWGKMQS